MSASDDSSPLTHLDATGRPRMVDVGEKPDTDRLARARGRLRLSSAGWEALTRAARVGNGPGGATAPDGAAAPKGGKGDPLTVAQVAAVQAVKRTAEWIPLAHPLSVTKVEVRWREHAEHRVLEVEVEVGVRGPTGVEMEALTGCSAALLTVYDMLKAADRGMILGPVWLAHKSGGRSGSFDAPDPPLEGADSRV